MADAYSWQRIDNFGFPRILLSNGRNIGGRNPYLFRYVFNFWSLASVSLDILHLSIAHPPEPELSEDITFAQPIGPKSFQSWTTICSTNMHVSAVTTKSFVAVPLFLLYVYRQTYKALAVFRLLPMYIHNDLDSIQHNTKYNLLLCHSP